MLSEQKKLENKNEFLNLLKKVNRPGIDKLIDWLTNNSDFFTAPSSTCYHGCYDGGLCQHSLNVYYAMKKLVEQTKEIALPEKQVDNISEETMIITCLMHDLCKTNFYKKEIKVFKDDETNIWHHYYSYKCEDNFPLGHGEKSVIMLQNFIHLTCNEIIAIRWHMGLSDAATTLSSYEKPAYSKANNECPLLILLQEADYFASFMMEYMVDPKVENRID